MRGWLWAVITLLAAVLVTHAQGLGKGYSGTSINGSSLAADAIYVDSPSPESWVRIERVESLEGLKWDMLFAGTYQGVAPNLSLNSTTAGPSSNSSSAYLAYLDTAKGIFDFVSFTSSNASVRLADVLPIVQAEDSKTDADIVVAFFFKGPTFSLRFTDGFIKTLTGSSLSETLMVGRLTRKGTFRWAKGIPLIPDDSAFAGKINLNARLVFDEDSDVLLASSFAKELNIGIPEDPLTSEGIKSFLLKVSLEDGSFDAVTAGDTETRPDTIELVTGTLYQSSCGTTPAYIISTLACTTNSTAECTGRLSAYSGNKTNELDMDIPYSSFISKGSVIEIGLGDLPKLDDGGVPEGEMFGMKASPVEGPACTVYVFGKFVGTASKFLGLNEEKKIDVAFVAALKLALETSIEELWTQVLPSQKSETSGSGISVAVDDYESSPFVFVQGMYSGEDTTLYPSLASFKGGNQSFPYIVGFNAKTGKPMLLERLSIAPTPNHALGSTFLLHSVDFSNTLAITGTTSSTSSIKTGSWLRLINMAHMDEPFSIPSNGTTPKLPTTTLRASSSSTSMLLPPTRVAVSTSSTTAWSSTLLPTTLVASLGSSVTLLTTTRPKTTTTSFEVPPVLSTVSRQSTTTAAVTTSLEKVVSSTTTRGGGTVLPTRVASDEQIGVGGDGDDDDDDGEEDRKNGSTAGILISIAILGIIGAVGFVFHSRYKQDQQTRMNRNGMIPLDDLNTSTDSNLNHPPPSQHPPPPSLLSNIYTMFSATAPKASTTTGYSAPGSGPYRPMESVDEELDQYDSSTIFVAPDGRGVSPVRSEGGALRGRVSMDRGRTSGERGTPGRATPGRGEGEDEWEWHAAEGQEAETGKTGSAAKKWDW
ncbi:hypothetical protein HDU67_000661 [Dinochytrium kinnereticum]|nr:hypothetical protein HDU67_000661 [Dinochytrium kinnereticum]